MSDLTTRPDLHQLVTELTRPHTHRVIVDHDDHGTTVHQVDVAALIDQLDSATSSKGDANGAGGYESRPAASVEALDVLIAIDHEASAWVRRLRHDDPGSTKAVVRLVGSLYPSAGNCGNTKPARDDKRRITCCARHQIAAAIRSWHTRAAIVTGWTGRAFAPNNTCTQCSKRRTLRIAVEDETAFCVSCHATWGDETTPISLLAEHIKTETGEDEGEAA
jgi:hypothetical protein